MSLVQFDVTNCFIGKSRHWIAVGSMAMACCGLLASSAMAFAPPIHPAFASAARQDDEAANNIAQTAFNAQNESAFEFAAKQWEKLIADHPTSPLIGKAYYNAGVCSLQINEYEKAMEYFKTSLTKLDKSQTNQIPQANLYLGYTQFERGKQLTATDSAKSKQLLTTATQTFGNLLTQHPKFEDLDQVCYFQGNAFNELKRFEDALTSYQQMIKYPKQTFKLEGLYAVADMQSKLGQHTDALASFEKVQAVAKTDESPLLNDIEERIGATLIRLSIADEESGDQPAAEEKLTRAKRVLQAVLQSESESNSNEISEIADDAQYQLANCLRRLGDFEASATAFQSLSENSNSRYTDEALVNAARNWIDADQPARATPLLNQVIAQDKINSHLAAHWLAGIHLKSKAFQTAYDVATQQLTKTEGVDSSLDPTMVALLMDQADAAFEIPEKRNGSIALFDAIANQHPDHPLAPSALHSSAFTSLDQGDFATAIKTATRFETKYSDDDFLPDTLEVKAESFLLNDQPAESSQVFEQLVSKFKDHPNHPRWQIRSGLASYMNQEHQTAIDKLTPLVDSMDDKANKAEAQFWIGLSQFEIEDFKSAAQSLANSYATHNRWDRTDETLLKLCRAQFALGDAEAATTTANTLINDYPDTPLLSDLHYRMGEVAYEAENFKDAFEHFEMIIQQYTDSQFLPYALFNAAWCKLELKEYKKSDALFSKLMTQFPTHELAAQAKIGRGASRRKTGDVASSIKDLTEFLDTQPEGKAKTNAMYELALAYVQVKQWDDAIQSFSDLIDTNPDSPQLDRYYYELAWAYQSAKQEDDAIKFFSKIANEAKDSPLAGEANFHVGTQAYNDEKYDEAIAAYTLCLDSKTADNIREKAAYKSAWAHYKQDQFQDAQIAFAKQNKLFATGELYADGMFMEAECLFRLKRFDSALTAYTAAQPVVEGSTQVEPKIRWLTMLHGAQCANKIKRYETALSLIESLDNSAADISFKQDGWLEKGVAHAGLKQTDEALASYRKAAAHPGKTGARAHCMVGDMLFKAKNFAAAIDEFKLVYYGFGGKAASPDVREWQAYAIYEAARCNFVQVDGATDLKQKFVTESIAQFEYLLKNYGDDRLATEAAKQLKTLKKIEFK